jgi:hypothetical protein
MEWLLHHHQAVASGIFSPLPPVPSLPRLPTTTQHSTAQHSTAQYTPPPRCPPHTHPPARRTLAELDADPASPPPLDCRAFFLHRPRTQLYRRIDARVEDIVRGGLLREAALLLRLGLGSNSCSAARAIGYRQVRAGKGGGGGEGEMHGCDLMRDGEPHQLHAHDAR